MKFSEAGRHPKKTLAEACVNSSKVFHDEVDEETNNNDFLSFVGSACLSSAVAVTRIPQSILQASISIAQPVESSDDSEQTQNTTIPDKVWKRVKDARGLPEQNITLSIKKRKTLKEEIVHNKNLMHKYSMRIFDDRAFIADKETGEEALNQMIGTTEFTNPIIALVAEYGAPALEMLKVGLSVWRSVFNLFTWRDPFLTSLFFFGAIFLICVLLVFPWRLFFFGIGVGAFGPQNWLLRVLGKLPLKKKKRALDIIKNGSKKIEISNFQFHNHLTTDAGIDVRDKKYNKLAPTVRRAVVPNSPLISRRFYDWPPDPSVSKVDIYSEQ